VNHAIVPPVFTNQSDIMKVILQQDVAKLGRRFAVVEVPSGYGLNKLIPQGLAKLATPENLKVVKAQEAKTAASQAASNEAFAETAKMLEGKVIDVNVEASEEGKLYQALKVDEIVAAVLKETEINVPPDQVVIKTPIKEIGEHTVELANGKETGSFTINVITG